MTDRGSRSRSSSRELKARTITPAHVSAARAIDSQAGKLAAAAWLSARGLRAPSKRWDIEVALGITKKPAAIDFDATLDTRFHLYIYSEEWGFRFGHGGRASWIRVTDIPFVHGADELKLLASTPPLESLGSLLRALETEHAINFERAHAAVSSTIPGADAVIRKWIQTL